MSTANRWQDKTSSQIVSSVTSSLPNHKSVWKNANILLRRGHQNTDKIYHFVQIKCKQSTVSMINSFFIGICRHKIGIEDELHWACVSVRCTCMYVRLKNSIGHTFDRASERHSGACLVSVISYTLLIVRHLSIIALEWQRRKGQLKLTHKLN